MKAHLLFPDADFNFAANLAPTTGAVIQDLELATILDAMAQGDDFFREVATSVLLTMTHEPTVVRHRQEVLADCLAHPDIVRRVYATVMGAFEDRRGLWGYSSRSPGPILFNALKQLDLFITRLRELRRIADDHINDVRSPGLKTLFTSLQTDLSDEYFAEMEDHLRQLRFREGVLLSMHLARDNSGRDYVLRSPERRRLGWWGRLTLSPRDALSFSVAPRDEAGGQALAEITSRGINLVANAVAQSADHILSYFQMLRAELAFYLGCVNLRDCLAERDVEVVMPQVEPWTSRAWTAEDLRDVSLALRSTSLVVGNDVRGDRRPLTIITGANSGGKSTFLRSVGQAQLMAQCGMFVTARSLRVSLTKGIFTHFIREEDASMASGRLDEELSRMDAIAATIESGSMILFNESFAATNEREGSEIARQIVRALLETDVRVVFVTHQFDFASSFMRFAPSESLFLRAPRGEQGQRNFRLEEAIPLPTSFGEDIYWRLGGWLDNESPERIVS